ISWPLTSAGIVCADVVLYAIGRRWGARLFELRWVRWVLAPERRLRLEKRFHKHGIKLLIAARFLPPLRTGLFMIAGSIRFSFARSLAAAVIFAVLGVGVLFFFGAGLVELIHRVGSRLLWAAVPFVLVYGLYRYYRFLRGRELRGEPPPPVSVLELPPPPPEPEPLPPAKEPSPPAGVR